MASVGCIDIKFCFSVDKDTADMALKICQLYLNSHAVTIGEKRKENGEVELFYEPFS